MDKVDFAVDLINALTKQFEASLSDEGFAAWINVPEGKRKQIIFTAFVDANRAVKQQLSK